MKNRHSEFDVSNSVQVTDSLAVRDAVCDIFSSCYLNADQSGLRRAFEDFDRLFEGHFRGYHGCDTFYHDKQHTLDMSLALARLIDGYERHHDRHHTLGAKLFTLAIITALFHDSGYIRKLHDHRHHNGAEYTMTHVSRSASFLRQYLVMVGLGDMAEIAANMVHYTGYEVAPENINLPSEEFHIIGYMIGTADLIAQMSDRCYLEKCRDRLYTEFVLGGLAEKQLNNGDTLVIYSSPQDLLTKTPDFYNQQVKQRLDTLFHRVYEYAALHFGGDNLYMSALNQNIEYMRKLITEDRIQDLHREPPSNLASNIQPQYQALVAHR